MNLVVNSRDAINKKSVVDFLIFGMGLSMMQAIVHSVHEYIIVNSSLGLGIEILLLFLETTIKKNYVGQTTA